MELSEKNKNGIVELFGMKCRNPEPGCIAGMLAVHRKELIERVLSGEDIDIVELTAKFIDKLSKEMGKLAKERKLLC